MFQFRVVQNYLSTGMLAHELAQYLALTPLWGGREPRAAPAAGRHGFAAAAG